MSFNVFESSNFIRTNRPDNFEFKYPLITLLNNKNFKLTNKNRGKLINKPVYSGFKKNTLSSIPRDVEIILLDKNKDELCDTCNKNILCDLETNSYNKHKTLNENTGITSYISNLMKEKKSGSAITNNTKLISTTKRIKSKKAKDKNSKEYKKIYNKKLDTIKTNLLKDKKNFSLELYRSQFLPGPSDYSTEKSFDRLKQQNKYRYTSLFKTSSTKSKKLIKNTLPGPGSYIQLKNLIDNDDKHLGIDLCRKEKRFKNLFSSASLSPWYYSSLNNEKKMNNEGINKRINLFNKKDVYDFKKYILKKEVNDKGVVLRCFIEEIPQNKIQEIKQYKNIDKIKKNENENQKINEYKFDNLLKKYIQVRDAEKEYEVPGPGKYNIYVGFDKILKDKEIERLQYSYKPENLIPEEVLKKYTENKNNPNLTFAFKNDNNINVPMKYINKSKSCENIHKGKENRKNSGGTLPFISKQKRIKYHDATLSQHNPGPCYYYNDEPSSLI